MLLWPYRKRFALQCASKGGRFRCTTRGRREVQTKLGMPRNPCGKRLALGFQRMQPVGLKAERLLYVVYAVELFPSEQLHFHHLRFVITAGKGLLHHLILAPHVSVSGRLGVDGLA